MEEAYRRYTLDQNYKKFPWDWKNQIRPIEIQVHKKLNSKGLYTPPNLFCKYEEGYEESRECVDPNHPHKLIASARAEVAINTWGKDLFPLMKEPEFKLKGLRDMPGEIKRSTYYGITGVIDVLGSFEIQNCPSGNLILFYLSQCSEILKVLNEVEDEYEIIVDYKGSRRPSVKDKEWKYHEWQVLTYAHLRKEQKESSKPVAAIILYLNELNPSEEDIECLKEEVYPENGEAYTDILPELPSDKINLKKWDGKDVTKVPTLLSKLYKEKRSIRIIPINNENIDKSLKSFDNVVMEIENCILCEMEGRPITESWKGDFLKKEGLLEKEKLLKRTCTACDFKTNCPSVDSNRGEFKPSVP